MAGRRYIRDYTLQDELDEKGRLRTVGVYTGPQFRFRLDPDRVRRSGRLCAGLSLLSAAAVMVPLLLTGEMLRVWYVTIPLVLCLIPISQLVLWAGRVLSAKPPVTREGRDKLSRRAAPWSMAQLILAGLGLMGQAVWFFGHGFALGDLPVTAATLILMAAAGAIFSQRGFFEMEELPAE